MSAVAAASSIESKPSAAKLVALFAFMVTLWSLSFVVIKQVSREVPPVVLTAMRIAG